jgi:VWFA-related protein
VVALAFHRLSPEARALAHRAARSYLEREAANDYAGVFVVDQGLTTVQTYTSDRTRLGQAIDAASTRTTSAHDRVTIGTGGGAFGDRDPSVSPTVSAESPGRPPREQGFSPAPRSGAGDPSERILRLMAERMEQSFQDMSRVQQGHGSIDGLLALVSSLGMLPGRKTVVFFAESLSLPSEVQARFDDLIAAANRANVSVYTIDAAGLRVHSEQRSTARGIAAIGRKGSGDDPRDEEGLASPAYTRELERNERLLRQDPAAALGLLARSTGGFFVGSTNDLASAFRRIDDDRRFHYLLTYAPSNSRLDGGFRRVSVKVKRRGVEVRARSGYAAVPALGGFPVLRFEANALAALAAAVRPTAIHLQAGAVRFPQTNGDTRVALFVSLPGSGVAYFVDDKRTAYQTHFTILARILDEHGEVVRKGSEPYRFSGPADGVAAARAGRILFYRQPQLPPGRYTIEYALYDELSGDAGTGSFPLVVEAASPSALAMSDLMLVERAEREADPVRRQDHPLVFGDLLLYPNLTGRVVASATKALAFAYRAHAGTGPVTGTLELRRDGAVISSSSLPVPSPGVDGWIAHAAQLPIPDLQPGRYELRITLRGGQAMAERVAAFNLEP